MSKRKKPVILRRHGARQDLLSTIGSGISEVNVTGFLGYIISFKPKELLEEFGIKNEIIENIYIEKSLIKRRCDILLETSICFYVIEAKLFYEDPIPQLIDQKKELSRFTQKKIKLIGITNNKNLNNNLVKIIGWQKVHDCLKDCKNNSSIKYLNQEFTMHLENNGLVKGNQFDIYAREVSDELSIEMFLKGWLYSAPYEKSANIEKCNFFAPHFGKKVPEISPGISYGISYISQIRSVEYVENKNTYTQIVHDHLKKNKLNKSYPELEKKIENIQFERPLVVLLLNKPHLVFNPPIQKDKLQEGSGWLGKRYFTFEDFFNAAHL